MHTPRRSMTAALAAAVGLAPLTLIVGTAPPAAAASTAVVINEIITDSDTVEDSVELLNTGTDPVDVSGWTLRDDSDVATKQIVLAADTTIAPGGRLVVITDDDSATGFGLGGGDSPRLFTADGTTLIDDYSWTAHAASSYGRCPDLIGGFAETAEPTRGEANDCLLPGGAGAVRINEVESNDDATDWVEITNTGATPVDVSGWIVRDNDDDEAATIPAATTLAPGGFLAVDTDVATDSTDFGLGGGDMARLFLPDGITLVDAHRVEHARDGDLRPLPRRHR